MPDRPLKHCPNPSCRGGCKGHTRTPWGGRPAAHVRGYTSAYRAQRPIILARDPLCTVCRKRPSTQVDHILPVSRGGGNDPSNLRGVCQPCNSRMGSVLGGKAA